MTAISVQILPLQIAHHLHVTGLAVCIASGQQVFVAWSQILLTDALIGRVTVRAGVDAGHDAGGNVIILADKRFAVRLRGKIAVAEGAESGKLRAVIRLTELLTNGGRDEAQSEELLAEAAGNGLVIAQICLLYTSPSPRDRG